MSNLILRNSNRPLSVLDEMDRILDTFFVSSAPGSAGFRNPAVDVTENEKEYRMTVEIPGLSEKDVELKVDHQLLTISSRKESEKDEQTKEGWLLRERKAFNFARSFTLPDDVDRDNITASAEHGILSVVLPRQEKAKPRVIDIKRA